MTDAENQTTTYTYDELGRKFQTTWPDHVAGSNPGDTNYGITATTFDPAGRTLRTTDQLGDTVTYLYDLASRLTTREYRLAANSPTGQAESTDTFTYDQSGRMLTGSKGRYNNTVTFSYDESGLMNLESLTILGQTYNLGYGYNADRQLTSITYPDGDIVTQSYTPRHRLADITRGGNSVASLSYDDSNRLTQQTFGNNVVTNFSYEPNSNLLAAIDVVNHPELSTAYTYDDNKNVLSETRGGVMQNFSITHTFDDQNRLTAWNRLNNESQLWNLSPVGDWTNTTINGTQQTRTYGNAHELTAINTTPITYDPKGNTTQEDHDISLVWDIDNKLKSVSVPASPNAGKAGTHTYQYDALGRRVAKIVNDVTNNVT